MCFIYKILTSWLEDVSLMYFFLIFNALPQVFSYSYLYADLGDFRWISPLILFFTHFIR